MRDFMAAVCVLLPEPRVVTLPSRPAIVLAEASPTADHGPAEIVAIGYYRNIAVRTDDDHVKDVLMSFVTDGDIHWGETAWHEMEDHAVPKSATEGVWYAGKPDYFSAWR